MTVDLSDLRKCCSFTESAKCYLVLTWFKNRRNAGGFWHCFIWLTFGQLDRECSSGQISQQFECKNRQEAAKGGR